MLNDDLPEFTAILDATCALLSRGTYVPNDDATLMFFSSLRGFPIEAVRAGFDAHVKDPQRGRFVPVPADVIAQITGMASADGRPGPEEAWAIAVSGADEAATIVWTPEISAAWGMARVVMQGGDEVGARMTFREVYNRLVEEARHRGEATSWTVSLGHDAKQRERAIEHAQTLGRLPPPSPTEQPELLEGPDAEAAGFGKVLGNPNMPPHVREKLMRLRDRLSGDGLVPDSEEFVDPAVVATRDAQQKAAEQVADYIDAKNLSMADLIANARRLGQRDGA